MESYFTDAIEFISRYRIMEKSNNNFSEDFIKIVLPPHQVEHLCNSWRRRKKAFGSFFLNLSHANQGRVIKAFGIEIDGYDEYLHKKQEDEIASFFLEAPSSIMWLHGLMLYFENNGIGDSGSLKLDTLPRSEVRFGNSANWGKYILSLSLDDQQIVLSRLRVQVFSNELRK